MSGRVALCVCEEACANPALIGLDGERLDSQEWLDVFPTGFEARRGLSKSRNTSTAWVVSCNDVAPINLAASIKRDRPDMKVILVDAECSGSLKSRAHTAGIDDVAGFAAFARAYAAEKKSFSLQDQARIEVLPMHAEPSPTLPSIDRRTDAPAFSASTDRVDSAIVSVARPRAFLLPVVSGSGGAGKSAVSVVGAHIAQRMGYQTLLLDFDLQFGDAAMLSGRQDALFIDDAMARPDLLDRQLEKRGDLSVLAAPSRLEAAEGVVRGFPDLLESIVSRYDVVIANTGAAWAEQHAVLLEHCSSALFLVDQRATSVRACKHALDLCSRCGIAAGPFRFAVNKCAKGAPLTSIDVSGALRGLPVFELRDGGREVEDCLSAGTPEDLIEARNDFCLSLSQVLSKLLPDGEARMLETGIQAGDARASRKKGKHAARWLGRGQ